MMSGVARFWCRVGPASLRLAGPPIAWCWWAVRSQARWSHPTNYEPIPDIICELDHEGRRARPAWHGRGLVPVLESYGVFRGPQPCRPMPIFRGVNCTVAEELGRCEEGPANGPGGSCRGRPGGQSERRAAAWRISWRSTSPRRGSDSTLIAPRSRGGGQGISIPAGQGEFGPRRRAGRGGLTPRSSLRSRAFCPGPAIGPGSSETIVADWPAQSGRCRELPAVVRG